MPYVTAKKLLLLPFLAMPFANAEIVEIPAEEMTESYIKDTTVIIRKQAPSEISKTRSVIRVSPIEDDFSEGEAASNGTEVQRAAYEQMPFDMTAQTQYQFESASTHGSFLPTDRQIVPMPPAFQEKHRARYHLHFESVWRVLSRN